MGKMGHIYRYQIEQRAEYWEGVSHCKNTAEICSRCNVEKHCRTLPWNEMRTGKLGLLNGPQPQ